MSPDAGSLFPSFDPFDTRVLAVDGTHVLYLEQFGNPSGIPAVFLHGGPGSGCQRDQARQFDPSVYRIVLFDQRGAGRSKPKRCLIDNTTAHLVADIETIRQSLDIERWLVVGGSWGSTLAVAYGEAHPDRLLGMVLRAVFLGTTSEAQWAFVKAAETFRPELWWAFVGLLPEAERATPLAAYGARLMDPDPRIHVPAARVWSEYERALSVLRPANVKLPDSLYDESATDDTNTPNTPFVEWHYISNDCFLEEGQLLRDADRLVGIPGIIVQGRYDLLCPPETAARLASRWTDADLRLVPDAGHSAMEPGIREGMVAAIREFASRLAS